MLTWKKYSLKGVARAVAEKVSGEALGKDEEDAATPSAQMEML